MMMIKIMITRSIPPPGNRVTDAIKKILDPHYAPDHHQNMASKAKGKPKVNIS